MSTQNVRFAFAGLSHDHVRQFSETIAGVDLVAVAESDAGIRNHYLSRHALPPAQAYDNLEAMLDAARPHLVAAMGSLADHIEVVRACAPRGIHVMVEKPLATTFADACEMVDLARRHGIYLVTNYETSWYPSTEYVLDLAMAGKLGDLRKAIFRHGHQGPRELGCPEHFLDWLTDADAGGGALIDFGCYGVNLMTQLMRGARPISVTALARQFKPDGYGSADDDATILLKYPDAHCTIEASWNWPSGRKDMEVCGVGGFAIAVDPMQVRQQLPAADQVTSLTLSARSVNYRNGFSYAAAVVRGEVVMAEFDLSAPANNLIVVEVLEAARRSARSGQTVTL